MSEKTEKKENLKSDLLLLISETTSEEVTEECETIIDDLIRQVIEAHFGDEENEEDFLQYEADIDKYSNEDF